MLRSCSASAQISDNGKMNYTAKDQLCNDIVAQQKRTSIINIE